MHIIAISGSLRKESGNTHLVKALPALTPEGMTIEIADISQFPLFNQDVEISDYPEAAQTLKDKIIAADGVFIATPEYNRSVPGVLKNAIDWLSRPYGKNAFAGKRVMTAGVTGGRIGTALAQSHLRQTMLFLNAEVIGQPELYIGSSAEVFAEDGSIKSEDTKALLRSALEALQTRIG